MGVLEASDDSCLEVTRQELNDLYDNHEELVRTVETDDRNSWFFPDVALKKNYCSRLYAQNILMTDTANGEGLVIDIHDLVESRFDFSVGVYHHQCGDLP